LGYFLKLDRFKAKDWRWLIENFKLRINHWCNRLLSLGGWYVLVKTVLEILLVYWLALAHILLFVLTKIRQLVFSFLWSGNKKIRSYHLCNGSLPRGLNFMEVGGLETSSSSTGI